MYYTYVLLSLKNSDIYIGSTENVANRLSRHNSGKVKSTRAYKPWRLLECREFQTRSEAVRNENFLKAHQQKELLKIKYGQVAK